MPRPKRRRKVGFEPDITLYKPAGVRKRDLEHVDLSVDELEALRLKNVKGMDQSKAAEEMDVSQPTFSRLLSDAREKVTKALVNGKAIRIEGGNYKFVDRKRRKKGKEPFKMCVCPECGNEQEKKPGVPCKQAECPNCGSKMVKIS